MVASAELIIRWLPIGSMLGGCEWPRGQEGSRLASIHPSMRASMALVVDSSLAIVGVRWLSIRLLSLHPSSSKNRKILRQLFSARDGSLAEIIIYLPGSPRP